jgi:thiol-disulfide isomerase/thioredoxin
VSHFVRYLTLRGVVGDPTDILPFTSKQDLGALFHPEGPRPRPVLVRFFEPWCAHCFRMRTAWEAAATFFRGRVHVVDVDCASSEDAKQFCDDMGVTEYPTIRLFSASSVQDSTVPEDGSWVDPGSTLLDLPAGWREYRADWAGPRSLAGIEWFLHSHRKFLVKDSKAMGSATQPVLKALGEDDSVDNSIFGTKSREPVRLRDMDMVFASGSRLGPLGLSADPLDVASSAGRVDFVREGGYKSASVDASGEPSLEELDLDDLLRDEELASQEDRVIPIKRAK